VPPVLLLLCHVTLRSGRLAPRLAEKQERMPDVKGYGGVCHVGPVCFSMFLFLFLFLFLFYRHVTDAMVFDMWSVWVLVGGDIGVVNVRFALGSVPSGISLCATWRPRAREW